MIRNLTLHSLRHRASSSSAYRAAALVAGLMIAVLLALLGGALIAQVSGDRGIAPVASSSDIDTGSIAVDVVADSPEKAREKGWELAQRKAWRKLGGPALPDRQIAGLVSAIVIEHEEIGPKRYIAKLGVVFDRNRAGRYLGVGAVKRSSAPMLLLPATSSAGSYMMYERRNPWQRAWAEFNSGTSRIDYVRPTGSGGESLLLTYGQTMRRSRIWWRTILDQSGAGGVLIPIAHIDYQFPGGPVTGTFTARYGPDSNWLDSFTMSADSPAELPAMLARAVRRFDQIFQRALGEGKLKLDPTLDVDTSGETDPAIARLIAIGRQIEQRERLANGGEIAGGAGVAPSQATGTTQTGTGGPQSAALRQIVVQFATPGPAAFDSNLQAVRGTPGVRSVAITSTAIGGTSVMSVGYAGTISELARALGARGFKVREGSNALAISR